MSNTQVMDEKLHYWYCPNCKEEVPGCHVTFNELHESCGHSVVAIADVKDPVVIPAAEYQRLLDAQKVIEALQDADGDTALDIIEKLQLAKVKQ